MCRYGQYGPYKEPFACFKCRKVFKQTSRYELPDHLKPHDGEKRICKCPQCGEPMADMGHDFKAPKQSDVKQWEKIRILYNNGFTFHSCGCTGPGYRPEKLNEVKNFLMEKKNKSKGELLLEKIISD